jgi:hypothetical protein
MWELTTRDIAKRETSREPKHESPRESWGEFSWRTYIAFALVGAIFVLCQVLSGGVPGNRAEDAGADPGDRSYRGEVRDETAGRAGPILPKVNRPVTTAPRFAGSGESALQTD